MLMEITAIALQGLEQAQAQLEQAAGRLSGVAAVSTDGAPVDTVDLSAEMVALLSAKNDFAMNINVIKKADEMQASLMDLLA